MAIADLLGVPTSCVEEIEKWVEEGMRWVRRGEAMLQEFGGSTSSLTEEHREKKT